jgi:F-type H+-transporting ATPase subunit alpha
VVEVLKQPQFAPIPVEEQVISIYAVTEGHMDSVDVGDVRRFEDELREYFRSRQPGILSQIKDTGKMPEGDEVQSAIADFKAAFEGSGAEE